MLLTKPSPTQSSYPFSWDTFTDRTIIALAQAAAGDSWYLAKAAPKAWLQQHYPYPNEAFIAQTKTALEQTWLPEYEGAKQVVDYLLDVGIGPMGSPRTQKDYVQYIQRCRNSKTVRLRLLEAMLHWGNPQRDKNDVSPFKDYVHRYVSLDPTIQPQDPRQPHDYQQEAWQKLSAHLAESEVTGRFEGLLVMPTGSGKTYTATRWLVDSVLNRGYRVLWLAHRHELLEQAAREFHALSSRAIGLKQVQVRIVSGIHCSTSQISKTDDVILCSIMSLAQNINRIKWLLTDPKTFLVVDEAHHAVASTYKALITALRRRERHCVLGLTATPTRTVEQEQGVLSALFGGRILYEQTIQNLVEREFLAQPHPIRVWTAVDAEDGVTAFDEDFLARFNKLSEAWLERLAHIEERNSLIIQHYLDNREKYGKTLIFALNVAHAALLTDRFRERGIRAEYVASYRLDASPENNTAIVQRFKNSSGVDGIDVLINVQLLTEGVDIPNIQTVFLARPTISGILIRQMIGRAMRGVKAGGTKEAYLVAFEDQWERFRDWQDPFGILPPGVIGPGPDGDPSPTPITIVEALPWDIIRSAAAEIAKLGTGIEADVFEVIPHGYYVLSRFNEDEYVSQIVSTYEHQELYWNELLEHLWQLDAEQVAQLRQSLETTDKSKLDDLLKASFDEFFFDCDHPWPSLHDIHRVLIHRCAGCEQPQFHPLIERDQCDPYKLADKIWEQQLGPRDKSALVEDSYTKLARAIYPDLRSFRAAVEDALYEIQYPEDTTRRRRAIPIPDPRPDKQMAVGPHHDLDSLMADVLKEGAALLNLTSSLPAPARVEWTRRILKGWYGQAYWDTNATNGQGYIRINRLLDSPDMKAEHLKFLLWHEYLHLYLQQGHSSTFREHERVWPNYQDADNFMDTLNEKFGIQYW
ncbi:DEAD/DEAH box helicase [Pseudanabaena sp. FACHB-2040]|uniref:DEAD/DEAH box helicase n=1 Tax=Pseudanabaena sp. FACHB-2040 TaxID=2692859 RepID=UPI0016869225|nr:DEAD/DEAH box helicase [Pseudanabaena sp. FACHB-2040]MBD2261192.1 DEAD/DEAH box helicase [Pseudanabaena sp. FACHB-2040]